jgi:protein CpxP
MNKGIALAVLGLGMIVFTAPQTIAQAPAGGTMAQKADKLEALAAQLKLTPEQKMKLLPILKAEAPKLQEIKDNTSLTRMQKLEQVRTLHEQTNPQVQAILTPDQFTQLQTIRRQEVQNMIQNRTAQ